MSEQGTSKKKKSGSTFLPVIGLFFAVLLLVVAYVVAPLVLEGIGSYKAEWDQKIRVDGNPENEIDPTFHYLMTGILWLALMGLSMTLVAAAAGPDPNKEALKYMSAPPANKKAVAKQLKRDLRDAKRRARQKKK